jgi:hypothetical protein
MTWLTVTEYVPLVIAPHRTQLRTISMIFTFDNKFDQADEADYLEEREQRVTDGGTHCNRTS